MIDVLAQAASSMNWSPIAIIGAIAVAAIAGGTYFGKWFLQIFTRLFDAQVTIIVENTSELKASKAQREMEMKQLEQEVTW